MASNPAIGEVLASKFRLEALLGAGGMGFVFRAVNLEIGREVAIKVMRPEFAALPSMVERFIREARAANLVRHPNVVDILDIGRDKDGSPFIVQELLKGEDLDAYASRRGGRLVAHELAELVVPVVEALGVAHANGVVHRDIKPSNIFLAEQGSVRIPKLLDFGISKLTAQSMRATATGMIGTPAYMAPEQIRGGGQADARSDVWAVGVMIFELLAGRLPFEGGDTPAIFVEIATKAPARLRDVVPSVPPELSRVVERCLRRNPEERYPSATEVARDLDHSIRGEAIEPTQRRSLVPLDFAPRPVGEAPPRALASSTTTARQRRERPTELEWADNSANGPTLHLELQRPTTTNPAAGSNRPHAAAVSSARARVRNAATDQTPTPFLIAITAVVLGIVATAGTLTSVLGRTDGLALLSVAGDSAPSATSKILVHGGLASLALMLSALLGIRAVRAWSRLVSPSIASALVQAIASGALLFLSLQLFRATW